MSSSSVNTINTVQELVAAREARGLSIEDMQRQLKLHMRQVVALESGDWAALPGAPFVRGTLRNYGKLLAVDVGPLLDTVGVMGGTPELRPMGSIETATGDHGMMGFGNGGPGSRWIWLLLVVAGIGALALFFGREGEMAAVPSWLGGGSERVAAGESARTTIETVPIPAPQSPAGAGSASADAAGMGGMSAMGAMAVQPGTTPAGAPAAVAPEASASAMAPVVDGTPIRLVFAGESWVDVRQSDGKVLLFGLQKADTTRTVGARGPVSLTIGNAAKVRLEYDGRLVDMKAAGGSGVARLRLP